MDFEDLNSLGKARKPFLFVVDFKATSVEAIPLDEIHSSDIEVTIDEKYQFIHHENYLNKESIPFKKYKKKFDYVLEKICLGETYLLNLTAQSKIQTALTLKEIYSISNAHYKLRYKDKFVCFSPETFIKIQNNTINTYPMKGTIDASQKDAKKKILQNSKEMAEHIMVVDLLRNDLSIVATDVKVERFRYVTKIKAGKRDLLQVSSHISGKLTANWQDNIGDILQSLLPAGSICGTPKRKTLEIIEEVEGYERGYYSGVFGLFDGERLDSGVMIRFIEKKEDGYYYKSGGGITLDSRVEDEYNELKHKIYLP